jgi:hypothetical protein
MFLGSFGPVALSGGALSLRFSYRNSYSDTSNLTTYSFAGCDLGAAHSSRLVVVGTSAQGVISASSMTVGGVSATLAVASAAANGRVAELWYALVPTGATATIEVVWSGGASSCIIHVWSGYPASATPVDAVGANNSANTLTLTDLAKTAGGFACFCSSMGNNTATVAYTGNNAETITENYDAILDTQNSIGAASFVVTATTTTDDFTATWSASSGCGFVGATWA